MEHDRLLDYAYDTNPCDDIALEPTDKHHAITLKTRIAPIRLQGLACFAPIMTVGYGAIVARQDAAIDGISAEEYIDKLILHKHWERQKTAEEME